MKLKAETSLKKYVLFVKAANSLYIKPEIFAVQQYNRGETDEENSCTD